MKYSQYNRLLQCLKGEAVGFEADTAVEEVAWLTTFGSVEGMGLPSFVCNLTTYKIKAYLSVRRLRECRFFFKKVCLKDAYKNENLNHIFLCCIFFSYTLLNKNSLLSKQSV